MHNHKKKEIIINVSGKETRIAIMEDGELAELYLERPEDERMVGDIYRGRIENVVGAVKAAFVDIGLKQNGFLPFGEAGTAIHEYTTVLESMDETPKPGRRRRERQGPKGLPHLRSGQNILVQVTKEPLGTKGARLTTEISLPGRFLVLVPNDQNVGVSKKISDDRERRRLRGIAKAIKPEGFGLIMRTVAMDKDEASIRADLDNLLKTWKKVQDKTQESKGPGLIHKEMGIASSVIRDLFSPDISRLVVDSRALHGSVKKYLEEVAPNLASRLELYKGKNPLFDEMGIESEIEKSLSRKVNLKSGGDIVFDQTEALAVIDVNSGRSVSQRDHELNALKTDLEAAREIAKQLRLRDIGGIIVIDFIDLEVEKHRARVVGILSEELRRDRAAFDVLPMNGFGLVAMTRERTQPSLLYRYSESCPRCGGLGRVPAKSTVLSQIERKIKQIVSETGSRRLVLRVYPEMMDYLKEGLMSPLRQIMVRHLVTLRLERLEDSTSEAFEIEASKGKK